MQHRYSYKKKTTVTTMFALSKSKSFLALSIAIIAFHTVFDAQDSDDLPKPFFAVDFSDPEDVAANVQESTDVVLTGPGGFESLRIDECGKHARVRG